MLVLASIGPAAAQADLAEMDDAALAVVESYFTELEALQAPLFEYIDANPSLDMSDTGFLAGYAPLVEEAAERAKAIVAPDCLVPVHEHVLDEAQHRLDGLAAVQTGDLPGAYEQLMLAEDASDAAIGALDDAPCVGARPSDDPEQVTATMTRDQYEDYIDFLALQGLFVLDATEGIAKYNAAKNQKQVVKAAKHRVKAAKEHVLASGYMDLHPCYADDYRAYREALRGFRKYAQRELAAAKMSKWQLNFKSAKKANKYTDKVLDNYDPGACEAEIAEMVESF